MDALREITRIPDARPADILRRLGTLIRTGNLDYVRLARFARAEPPRVRALLGALGEELRLTEERRVPAKPLKELRASVNSLTSFMIPGARDALPRVAARWKIK